MVAAYIKNAHAFSRVCALIHWASREHMKKSRKPYNERTDIEKLQSQWWKLSGLHTREEWSAAVVRAATAAEIAANIAIRKEFQDIGTFAPDFVDSLLVWANGLAGKLDRLLLPITKGTDRHDKMSELKTTALKVNKTRNAIAHRGEFCSERAATEAIAQAKRFVEGVIRLYEPAFRLKERKS